MVNGGEESHSAIVVVKPPNKAERSVAEAVEPRAGTEGNAQQGGALRTPNREGALHGLDRVRKAARERKKERFTALWRHITVDLLEEAFRELRKNASPGVDGLTWETYERDLGRRLEDLYSRVRRGAYRALPSRRVDIPKPDGTAAPAGGRRAGGQDRPEGDGDGAERCLRGGFPRVQLRVPARTRRA